MISSFRLYHKTYGTMSLCGISFRLCWCLCPQQYTTNLRLQDLQISCHPTPPYPSPSQLPLTPTPTIVYTFGIFTVIGFENLIAISILFTRSPSRVGRAGGWGARGNGCFQVVFKTSSRTCNTKCISVFFTWSYGWVVDPRSCVRFKYNANSTEFRTHRGIFSLCSLHLVGLIV